MVTLVVLSAGIVFIYKSFFLCTDYIARLSMRMHASELIDERIADISRSFQVTNGSLAFEQGPMVVPERINRKIIDFHYHIEVVPVPGYDGLFNLQVEVSWADAGKLMQFFRWAALSL